MPREIFFEDKYLKFLIHSLAFHHFIRFLALGKSEPSWMRMDKVVPHTRIKSFACIICDHDVLSGNLYGNI